MTVSVLDKELSYTYEWTEGLVFSVLFGKEELLSDLGYFYRCNYHSGLGIFEFWKQDSFGNLTVSELPCQDKNNIKFFVINVLDDILKEETYFLTTMEPFSK